MRSDQLWIGLVALSLNWPVVATVHAESPSADVGLTAHWTFDGLLTDEAGRARDQLTARDDGGKVVTARFVTAKDIPGASLQAIALFVEPGDAEYLTAPLSDDLELGPAYSIEMWIHPTAVDGWNRLVLNWGNAPNYAYHVGIHDGLASLYHGQSDGRLVFAEGGRIEPGRWYHIAAIARSDTKRLSVYLGGEQTASVPFDGTLGKATGEAVGIGDSAGIPSRESRFQGYVDEVTLWNRALSDEEIRSHYQQRAKQLGQLELARRQREEARRAQRFAQFDSLDVEEIVFVERAPGRDPQGHYYANFGYSCIDPTYWLHGIDGGKLYRLNLRSGKVTLLLDDPGGAIRDPRVHYDAERILFSYRKSGSHHYHLYEIDIDGTGLRQITGGLWDDVEPAYLPDGGIVFCSTRCRRWIGCWLAETATLHRCDGDGENLRMLSSGSFTENTPAVLPDGRVLYTRWEYVNRDPVSFHHLWTMNPDGSGQTVYFGNMQPGGVFIDAKPIPGTDRVALINSPGHGRNEHTGFVATVTDRQGPNVRSAMVNVSKSNNFRDPHPLSEDALLAAQGRQILLMDSHGESQVLFTGTGADLHEPCPIVRRPRERSIPSQTDLAQETGTLIVGDVYLGRNMEGIERGQIKKLLVMEDLPKPANFHGGGSQPIGHGVTSTLKRILGTVPVEADGSAHFEVPAMRSIYFALLDGQDRSVKQMRSFVTLQPGETMTCVGCHEMRHTASATTSRPTLQATARAASRIEPINDVPGVIDFPRDVQPVLDRHCVRCHNHEAPDRGVVLSGDRGPVFSRSYYELLLHWQVKDTGGDPRDGSGREPGNNRPYSTYSSASPMMKKIDGSHWDLRLDPREKQIVRLWIDTGGQYAGTYAAYGTGQVGGCWGSNQPVREMADGWPSTPAAQEAVERRCGRCHPKDQLPRHVTDRIPLDSWGDMLSWTRPLSRFSRHRLYNLSRPKNSLILLTPLSGWSGGHAVRSAKTDDARPVDEDRTRPPRPIEHPIIFTDTDDPDYRSILTHIQAARERLDEIKRFDMPGFRPNEHYVREMKRYGVLPMSLADESDPIDVYATDEAYWQSFWHRPRR